LKFGASRKNGFNNVWRFAQEWSEKSLIAGGTGISGAQNLKDFKKFKKFKKFLKNGLCPKQNKNNRLTGVF